MNKIGALIGNWNDRHFKPDSAKSAPRMWNILNYIASTLYTWNE